MSIIHVVSGPDHLAAVVPLAIDSRKKSWAVGFSWGIGHTLGMLMIGLIFLLVKESVDIDSISGYGEQVVGFLLIAIGLWAILKVFLKTKKHTHKHIHNGEVHEHEHEHLNGHVHLHKKTHRQNVFSALGIGIIHGIAGVSHLIAILPTLAWPSKTASVMYLSGFGVGTVVAMMLFAFILGFIAQKTAGNRKIFDTIRIIGGALAIAVGIWWIILAIAN